MNEDWHRHAVGGMWDEVGALQIAYLIAEGLRREHALLDIGCGSLRGGSKFIGYLDPGRYVGLDRDAALIEAGRTIELPRAGLAEKAATFVVRDDFDVAHLGRRFDYAIAQSVFTHLSLNAIMRCLARTAGVLQPGGRLYATFFEAPDRYALDPIRRPEFEWAEVGATHFDADPHHYHRDTLAWAAEGAGLRTEYVGDWGHPRGQRMLRFVRSTQAPVTDQ